MSRASGDLLETPQIEAALLVVFGTHGDGEGVGSRLRGVATGLVGIGVPNGAMVAAEEPEFALRGGGKGVGDLRYAPRPLDVLLEVEVRTVEHDG